MSKINILFLIIGVLLLASSIILINIDNDNVIEVSDYLLTKEDYKIPYIYLEDANTKPIATAIILHGHFGSKVSMKNIGIALAHIGINSYLIDLPGYGEFEIKYAKNNLISLQSVYHFYNWLKDNNKIIVDDYGNYNLILIGYGVGAETVTNSSISKEHLTNVFLETKYTQEQYESHAKHLITEVDTTIIISNFPKTFISKNEPKNLFAIISDIEKVKVKSEAIKFLKLNKIDFNKQTKTSYEGTILLNNRLKIKFYPCTNYLNIIYKPFVINDILKWIINLYKINTQDLKNSKLNSSRDLFIYGLIIGIILLIFPLSELISKLWVFDFTKPKEPYTTDKYIIIFLKSIISIIISLAILMVYVLFGFIEIGITEYFISIFFYLFLINLILFRNYIFTACRYDIQIGLKILLGLLISVLIYFLAGLICDIFITNLTFTLTRFLKFLLVLFVCLLYFIMDEFIFRTALVYSEIGFFTYLKSFFTSFINKLIIIIAIAFLSLFYFSIDANIIFIFVPVFVILFFILQFISIYLFRKFRSYIISGFVTAFIVSWILTVIPPLI